jgi:hypothetical protein
MSPHIRLDFLFLQFFFVPKEVIAVEGKNAWTSGWPVDFLRYHGIYLLQFNLYSFIKQTIKNPPPPNGLKFKFFIATGNVKILVWMVTNIRVSRTQYDFSSFVNAILFAALFPGCFNFLTLTCLCIMIAPSFLSKNIPFLIMSASNAYSLQINLLGTKSLWSILTYRRHEKGTTSGILLMF